LTCGSAREILDRGTEGGVMFTRLSTYQGDTDALTEGFRRTVEPLEQMEGFVRAYFLTNSAAGRAMTVTIWETEAAMAATAQWANKAREHAAHDAGARVQSVESYEVAFTAEKAALRG
jgi:heme-degrading monooxygenase HmoA